MFRQSYGFDKTFSLPTVGKLMEPKIEFKLILYRSVDYRVENDVSRYYAILGPGNKGV